MKYKLVINIKHAKYEINRNGNLFGIHETIIHIHDVWNEQRGFRNIVCKSDHKNPKSNSKFAIIFQYVLVSFVLCAIGNRLAAAAVVVFYISIFSLRLSCKRQTYHWLFRCHSNCICKLLRINRMRYLLWAWNRNYILQIHWIELHGESGLATVQHIIAWINLWICYLVFGILL